MFQKEQKITSTYVTMTIMPLFTLIFTKKKYRKSPSCAGAATVQIPINLRIKTPMTSNDKHHQTAQKMI